MKPAKNNQEDDISLNNLLPHQRNWAKSVVEAISCLPQKPDRPMPRFVAPEKFESQKCSEAKVDLIPPADSHPTLDGNHFNCLLDWQIISPLGDWMDVRLLFVNERGRISTIEFIDSTSESSGNDLLEIDLTGQTWEDLNQQFSPFFLRHLFENIWFGYRSDNSGTGATVIGVVDARRTIDGTSA